MSSTVAVYDKIRVVTRHVTPDYESRLNDLVQAYAANAISQAEMSEIRSRTRRHRRPVLERITDALFPSLRS